MLVPDWRRPLWRNTQGSSSSRYCVRFSRFQRPHWETAMFDSIADLNAKLAATGYFIAPVMIQVVFLAAKLQKPLLLEGPAGSGKGQKKPSTCKSCGNRQKRTLVVEKMSEVWKSSLFSGTLALLTRHLRTIRVVIRTLSLAQVMASPSPLDRCWVVKDSPLYLSILPALRAAVEEQWHVTQRSVLSRKQAYIA